MASSSALAAAHLAKQYGTVTAVDDLTLDVARGEIFGFLGPNGAGKTTSVKMLVGLVRPTSGEGTLLGRPLGDVRARRKLGYLPELFRYQEWLSGREVLQLHAKLIGIAQADREIEALIERAGLHGRGDARVGSYSKGMQQRLGLAVALLGSPVLVVLDEPTSALDPIGRLEVRELLRELKARGTTVFLNSHLLTEVEQVCDRVAIITKGRVVAQGSLHQIVGERRGVRVHARANGTPVQTLLAPFGAITEDGDALLLSDVEPARVPQVVSALVHGGAEVFRVEPTSAATLEKRFLELTRGPRA